MSPSEEGTISSRRKLQSDHRSDFANVLQSSHSGFSSRERKEEELFGWLLWMLTADHDKWIFRGAMMIRMITLLER